MRRNIENIKINLVKLLGGLRDMGDKRPLISYKQTMAYRHQEVHHFDVCPAYSEDPYYQDQWLRYLYKYYIYRTRLLARQTIKFYTASTNYCHNFLIM